MKYWIEWLVEDKTALQQAKSSKKSTLGGDDSYE
jgi:hypothetical protein